MAKKILTKNILLSLVNRRNKAQLVWGIIATVFGGFLTIVGLIFLINTGFTGLMCLPFFAAPLVAGIILLCTRKTRRAAIVENDAFRILALPVIGKEKSEDNDGTICTLVFPDGFAKYVNEYAYESAQIGTIYYFVMFSEQDRLGICYPASEYQLSEELLPLVKLVQQ